MRRKLTLGITLIAVVALSALAAFAYTDPYASSGQPQIGPRLAQKMVARQDVGTGTALLPPSNPSKPLPVAPAMAASAKALPGYNNQTGSIPVAAASPQVALESRLKSLALDLR